MNNDNSNTNQNTGVFSDKGKKIIQISLSTVTIFAGFIIIVKLGKVMLEDIKSVGL